MKRVTVPPFDRYGAVITRGVRPDMHGGTGYSPYWLTLRFGPDFSPEFADLLSKYETRVHIPYERVGEILGLSVAIQAAIRSVNTEPTDAVVSEAVILHRLRQARPHFARRPKQEAI